MKIAGPGTLLPQHVRELEHCTFCPKLCRATCPVSNEASSETLTPWGKMSLAHFVHRGDVPADLEHLALVWACTGCLACRERCDHRVAVADVLLAARTAAWKRGIVPVGARRVSERFPELSQALREALAGWPDEAAGASATTLLVGCSAARHVREEATAAIELARWLGLGPLRLVRACCGLPLRLAGDAVGFAAAARALARELGDARRIVVLDPGCARTLREDFPALGLKLPPVALLVDELAAELDRLPRRPWAGASARLHEACQLVRAPGASEVSWRVAERLFGEGLQHAVRAGRQAECCGAGGLLPITYPTISRAIADARIAEHRAQGGGTLIASCPSTVRRLRSRGEPAQGLCSLAWRAVSGVPPVDHG